MVKKSQVCDVSIIASMNLIPYVASMTSIFASIYDVKSQVCDVSKIASISLIPGAQHVHGLGGVKSIVGLFNHHK